MYKPLSHYVMVLANVNQYMSTQIIFFYLSEKLIVLHFALRLSRCSFLCEVSAETAWLKTACLCCGQKEKNIIRIIYYNVANNSVITTFSITCLIHTLFSMRYVGI